MMRILGLDHIVLRVRDMERMIGFWRDALGCPVEKIQAELGLVHIRAGTALVDLVDLDGPLGRQGGRAPAAWLSARSACLPRRYARWLRRT